MGTKQQNAAIKKMLEECPLLDAKMRDYDELIFHQQQVLHHLLAERERLDCRFRSLWREAQKTFEV